MLYHNFKAYPITGKKGGKQWMFFVLSLIISRDSFQGDRLEKFMASEVGSPSEQSQVSICCGGNYICFNKTAGSHLTRRLPFLCWHIRIEF